MKKSLVLFALFFASSSYAQESVLTCVIETSNASDFSVGKSYDIPTGNLEQRGRQYFVRGVNRNSDAYITIDRETGEFKYNNGAGRNFLTHEEVLEARGKCQSKKLKF